METEKQKRREYNFIFWIGFLFAVVGAIFSLWYSTLFGLVAMITARWLEKSKEEENGKEG